MENRKKADLLLHGATFFCGKDIKTNPDFVAIQGNRILALGKEQEMEPYIGDETVRYSFSKDQLIIPGLHDNHIHLIQAGMLQRYVNLMEAASEKEAAEMAADYAKKIPDEKWILGVGWCRMSWEGQKLPTKETLDQVIADRPVMLLDYELHSAWVNSKALEICQITKDTPDPDFGSIERDADGEPTGYLYETAICLAGKEAFDFSPELVRDLIYRYMKNAVQWGITSISDMTPYFTIDLAYEDVFFSMDRNGELPIRVNAARNLFEDIEKTLRLKKEAEENGSGMYRIPYVKQFIDGVPANYTALLLDPYSDDPSEKGTLLLDPEKMEKAIIEAHKNGLSVRLHACGDGAVRMALDAYEKAKTKVGKSKSRHQIEHIEVIDPPDIKRFKELEVIASVQPEHINGGLPRFSDTCYPARLGKDREKYLWAFRSLLQSGAVLAAGSDCPVVEGNPFVGMYDGVTRLYPDGSPAGGWNPQEKLDIEELLHMYTWAAAYGEMREDELGSLETGKLADLVVLDRDILKVSAEEIRDTNVLLTVTDGKVVYKG